MSTIYFNKVINIEQFFPFLPKVHLKNKNIFISYSHLDEKKYKNEICKHLAPLRDAGLINDWNDRKIESGTWDSQIEDAMNEADIFLFLITQNFISSKYIKTKELTTAYKKYTTRNAKLIPVICDHCKWELVPVTNTETEYNEQYMRDLKVTLGKFQAFPKDAKPISEWSNPQEGFKNVIDQLLKLL